MPVNGKSRPPVWDAYRLFQTGSNIFTVLAVVIGGLSVWANVTAQVQVQAAALGRQSDDIKDLKNKQASDVQSLQAKLDIISEKLTDLRIQVLAQPGKKQ